MIAARWQLPADTFALLLNQAVKHCSDVRKLLEQQDNDRCNCALLSCRFRLPIDSFKLLLDSCVEHANIKKVLEQTDSYGMNCFMVGASNQLSIDFFKLLIDCCLQHGVDISKMLVDKDCSGDNCIGLASRWELSLHSFAVLIARFRSDESFQRALNTKNNENKSALDIAETNESKAIVGDPDCWKTCREWCLSQGIKIPPS